MHVDAAVMDLMIGVDQMAMDVVAGIEIAALEETTTVIME